MPQFDVSDRLRKARETAGYDQAELAELIGVSRETVGNYERGRTKSRKIVLNAWALATGVPVEWIRDGWAPRGSNPEPTVLLSPHVNNVIPVSFRPEPDKMPQAS